MSSNFVRAIVSANEDPENQGRVKLTYPAFSSFSSIESDWARVKQSWGSNNSGQWLVPNVGDEAIAYIEDGDFSSPVIIGFLYSENNPLPADANGKDKDFMIMEHANNQIKVDDKTIDAINSSGTGIKLDDKKIALGSSSVNYLEMVEKFCKALLDGQAQFVSTAMGPGSLNPGLAKDLQKIQEKFKKLKTDLG